MSGISSSPNERPLKLKAKSVKLAPDSLGFIVNFQLPNDLSPKNNSRVENSSFGNLRGSISAKRSVSRSIKILESRSMGPL